MNQGVLVDLTGKVAVVTGSGRGLGRAYATELARHDRLALWSHPSVVVVEIADGTGWSADAIAEVWPLKFASSQQRVGQRFPEPPASQVEGTEA
jgi:NAD(P)-dependent dehydrogenase (short-subunit alcohol dehydrogenase family)